MKAVYRGMEATKYVMAFEEFGQDAGPREAEVTSTETLEKIWKVIESGDFFCIISSYNPGNDPDVIDSEHQALQKDILKMKYAHLEQSFGYLYSDGDGLTSIRRKSQSGARMPRGFSVAFLCLRYHPARILYRWQFWIAPGGSR